jgi:hypothetical protein
MNDFSDDDLSAYLDGEAAPALRAALDGASVADPALAARLSRMRSNDRRLSAAIDAELGPMPDALLHALREPPPRPATARRSMLGVRIGARWALPLAAAVLIGFVMGQALVRPRGEAVLVASNAAGVVAAPDLARSLSNARSGVALPGGAGAVRVALSFRSSDGRFCRQFGLRAAGAASTGVACRDTAGWRIEAWSADRLADNAASLTAAGGPDDPVIAAALTRLGVADVLDQAGESAEIAATWAPGARARLAPAAEPVK